MNVVRKPFSCMRGQTAIRGFSYQCEKHNGIPVILSHAFLSNQKIMKKYAEALAREGYVAFTYDFSGGAILGKSDGKFSDMSIDTEKDDLKAVIAYVETLEGLDQKQLILLGASQGGFVSCLVAAEYQDRINRLILLYPALCIPDDARKGKMMMVKFDPARIEETLVSRPFHFSAKYPKSAMDIQIYDEIQKIKIPILLIHGSADKIVPAEYAKKAIETAVNADSSLVILENAGHGFNKKQFQAAMDHIMQYLRRG